MKKTLPGSCVIKAPCKINLHLRIGKKRPDGFHELESLFASLALADLLHFKTVREGDGDRLLINWKISRRECPPEPLLPEKNLVLRAVSLFRERTGFEMPLQIRLEKRIPLGAGLGGGSSDAASSLLALNFLSGAELSMEELQGMAILLGSDVPFFLTGGAAFVSGRGELVRPVENLKKLWVVLAKPPYSSGTANAFRLLDLAREKIQSNYKENAQFREYLAEEELILALGQETESWPFYNDFLPIFLDPETFENAHSFRQILETFTGNGASFANLSGSGSCCFGIFKAKKTAEKAKNALLKQGNYARLTFFLANKAKPVVK